MANKIVPTAKGVSAMTAPDFMQAQPLGTEMLKDYIQPPRLKVVQPTSRKPFSEMFKQGDVCVVPMMQLVGEFNNAKEPLFAFVPLFFWPEWVLWNPLETKGTLPAVRDRSFDPRSVIAIKARDEKKRNSEQCPECPEKDGKKLYLKYLEHLNYMVMPLTGPFVGMPLAATWASGEHRAGSNFNSLIAMRRAPLYGCQFEAFARERENTKGRWYGIDVENPRETSGITPFVMEPERFDAMKALHMEYKAAYDNKALVVDYDDGEETEAPKDSKEF